MCGQFWGQFCPCRRLGWLGLACLLLGPCRNYRLLTPDILYRPRQHCSIATGHLSSSTCHIVPRHHTLAVQAFYLDVSCAWPCPGTALTSLSRFGGCIGCGRLHRPVTRCNEAGRGDCVSCGSAAATGACLSAFLPSALRHCGVLQCLAHLGLSASICKTTGRGWH